MFKWLNERGYRELKTRMECLEAAHEALKSQHTSLRSRFYATRGPRSAPPPDRPPVTAASVRAEKDAILRQYLFGGRHVEPKPIEPGPGEAPEASPRAAGRDAWDPGDSPAARAGSERDEVIDDAAA